ncbi:MAG: hypothetical protein ACJAZ0_001711, partial [Halioglobus sp.]
SGSLDVENVDGVYVASVRRHPGYVGVSS